MKIVACGGRDYADFDFVYETLCELQEIEGFDVLVHGAAPGADSLAAKWAGGRVVEVRAYPADWAANGRAAGPIRNRRMAVEEKPEIVVTFPGGRGTDNMRAQGQKVGARILCPLPE